MGFEHSIGQKYSVHNYYKKEIVEDEQTPGLLGCNDIICIVISGTLFQIFKSNFAYWPKTRLSRLVRAKTKKDTLKLCNNLIVCEKTGQTKYIFFRNGNNFNSILDMCYSDIKLVYEHKMIYILSVTTK